MKRLPSEELSTESAHASFPFSKTSLLDLYVSRGNGEHVSGLEMQLQAPEKGLSLLLLEGEGQGGPHCLLPTPEPPLCIRFTVDAACFLAGLFGLSDSLALFLL